jgi:hypothetical protein
MLDVMQDMVQPQRANPKNAKGGSLMSLKPKALLVMNSGTFADQFDSTRLERLRNVVDLGANPWTPSLDGPELAERLSGR